MIVVVVSWCISIFCGFTLGDINTDSQSLASLQVCLPRLMWLIGSASSDQHAIIIHVLHSLTFLLPGITIETNHCKPIISHLANPSSRVQEVTMKTISTIIKYDSDSTRVWVDSQLIYALGEILKSTTDQPLRIQSLDVILNISRTCMQAESNGAGEYMSAIIKSNIISQLLICMTTDETIRWKSVKILRIWFETKNHDNLVYLLNQDIIKSLISSLANFKSYDHVLKDFYKFAGPTYNFIFISDILATLMQILTSCVNHTYVDGILLFDMEVVDKVKEIMMQLASEALGKDRNDR